MKKILCAGILLGAVTLASCTKEEEGRVVEETPIVGVEEETVSEKEHKLELMQEVSAAPLELTQQEKEAYHKRYVDAVEWLNEQKVGLSMEVGPIEQFKDNDWQDPDVFEKDIRATVENHLAEERELKQGLSEKDKEAKRQEDGKVAKKAYMYISEVIHAVEVAANFQTQYSEADGRQVFAGVDEITIQEVSAIGTWEQTSADVSLIDGGRTYVIDIEGNWSGLGVTFEKAFTVEFNCDQYGNVY